MTSGELIEEVYDHYIDQDKLVTIDRDPTPRSTGNGLMHLGLFLTMIKAIQNPSTADKLLVYDAVKACQVEPGVYNRYPGGVDQIAHDDITGVVAASVAVELEFHKDVANHCLSSGGIYNNDGVMEAKDFLARQVIHAMYWLGMGINVAKPILLIVLLRVMLGTSSYAVQHHFMFLEGIMLKFPRLRFLRKGIIKRMGLSAECTRYYGPQHPLTSLAKGIEENA